MNDHDRYREFRRTILDQLGQDTPCSTWKYKWLTNDRERPLAKGRRAIEAFRGKVASEAKHIVAQSPDNATLVRRALRLDPSMGLIPSRWAIIERWLFVLLPFHLCTQRANQLMRRVGTREGRELVFHLHVGRTLEWWTSDYCQSLDIGLRWLSPARTWREFDTLRYISPRMLLIARALGLTKIADVHVLERLIPPGQTMGEVILVLAREGVIRNTSELLEHNTKKRFSIYGIGDDTLTNIRRIVRVLLSHGAARHRIAHAILMHGRWNIDPNLLGQNLSALNAVGIKDITTVLDLFGDELCATPTAIWNFLLTELGVHSVEQIAKFQELLGARHQPSTELLQEIKSLGAGPADFAATQRLFVWLDADRVNPATFIARLRRLAAAPHSLSFADLSRCYSYLTERASSPLKTDRLNDFLDVLIEHDLSNAAAVLAFQPCFENRVSADFLTEALRLFVLAKCEDSVEERVAWVLKAMSNGYTHVFEYLIPAIGLRTLDSLQQALVLTSLGVPLLRFLIEVQGLNTLQTLRRWYYTEARGIGGYRCCRFYDDLARLLFKDAFQRKQFGCLESNQTIIDATVRRRASRLLVPPSPMAEEPDRRAYEKANERLIQQLRDDMVPTISFVLQHNHGMVFDSLLGDDQSNDKQLALEAQLGQLKPLVGQLVAGYGPDEERPTSLTVDAISWVYQVPPTFIREHWRQVASLAHHLDGLTLQSSYEMVWQFTRRQLSTPLDRGGISALIRAAEFSAGFIDFDFQDLFTAWQGLGPKQIRDGESSGSVYTLAKHLGCLLALASKDAVITEWVRQGFGALTTMDAASVDGYERISSLVHLFTEALPSALDAHAGAIVERLSDEDAEAWAQRLAPQKAGLCGRKQLVEAISRTRAKVLPVYRRWSEHQLNRFRGEADSLRESMRVNAVVSKHKSAFFAKKAAGLCTASNVKMWREERLSHLLVFDPSSRRLAGMALLYVQIIPEIDRYRASLVIRQINALSPFVAELDVSSIVDEFFRVATVIAMTNGLAAVAFPEPTGASLMSHVREIDNEIQFRFLQRPAGTAHAMRACHGRIRRERPEQVRTQFFANEHGIEPVGVVYVIWRGSTEVRASSLKRLEHLEH